MLDSMLRHFWVLHIAQTLTFPQNFAWVWKGVFK